MGQITKPSNRVTWNWEQHKNGDPLTSGEDFGNDRGWTEYGDQFKYLTKTFKKIGTHKYSDGTYKEFFNFTCDNGYKFSALTCHCKDFKATGDDYLGSTGYHLHLTCFKGTQSMEFMQNNRNTHSVPLATISQDADKYSSQKGGEPAAGKKKYFKATRIDRSYEGTYEFEEKYYNDLKDGYQNYDAKDVTGSTWYATTVWDEVTGLYEK